MSRPSKPWATGQSHTLPFEKLSPRDFERLTVWLIQGEGFERIEPIGAAGNEQGRDILAWKEGRPFAFQCKRVQQLSAEGVRKEIRKIRSLSPEKQPREIVFVTPIDLSAATLAAAREAWGDAETCHFWFGLQLDQMVKSHPEIVREFFQIPVEAGKAAFLHNLPYPTLGPLFQGRDEWLETLHQSLSASAKNKATAIAGKAVHGLGGVGKTRLAVEYAWRHAEEYRAAFFVGAQSPADLRRNLAALAGPELLNLPEQAAPEEEVREVAVLRWLRENGGWLLILDNVDTEEAAEAVDVLLPKLAGGSVLLSGRVTRWGAEVEDLQLGVLEEKAAVAFLLARTQGKRRAQRDPAKDEARAREIASELGCLPLALEQAGAYIAARRLTFAGYLGEWQARRAKVLEWFDSRVSHYPASVAVTWQTSVDQLTGPARRLLQRLAWLGPEPIPESLLEVPVPGVEPGADEPSPADLLAELETYSLVTRSTEAPNFTVHRLVQDVTRRKCEAEAGSEALAEALAWIDVAFVGDAQDVRTWPRLEPLAPHARAVVACADQAEIAQPTSHLMNNLAQLYDAKALLKEAEPLMRRALAIDENSFGPKHPNVAIRLSNLAALFRATNRLAEAEPLMRRALDIDENSFGSDHPNVARDLNNLAQLLEATNRADEAEPLMRRALEIDENSFGPEHPEVATDLNNLAALLQATNRLAEAEPLMRRALKNDENSFGSEHPNVATRLNNLAGLLQNTNRLAEAEPLTRRALDIDENSFGAEHPRVATDLNNLAQLLQATNRLAEAQPLMRRVVEIFEQSLGESHPNVAAALNNLAALLQATNRLAEAEPLMRRALDIDENSFGAEHPNVAILLSNLAALLLATNRLAEAEPLMRRAVTIFFDFTHRTEHKHPHHTIAFGNYTSLLQAMGKSEGEIFEIFTSLRNPGAG